MEITDIFYVKKVDISKYFRNSDNKLFSNKE